jgi:hypothetical protein
MGSRPYIASMPARKPRDPNEKPLAERFQEMARELGCDDDEDAFKAKLGQIARQKPKDPLDQTKE